MNQLIDLDTKWWNENLLTELFTSVEVATIKSIPLSGTNQHIWLYGMEQRLESLQ
jgi:hypothetical protein